MLRTRARDMIRALTVGRRQPLQAHLVPELIVWGGFDDVNYINTGGKYNPNTDNWADTTTTNAPSARRNHTAVWTGKEIIVWGGFGGAGGLRTGGRYDPVINSWAATSTAN